MSKLLSTLETVVCGSAKSGTSPAPTIWGSCEIDSGGRLCMILLGSDAAPALIGIATRKLANVSRIRRIPFATFVAILARRPGCGILTAGSSQRLKRVLPQQSRVVWEVDYSHG